MVSRAGEKLKNAAEAFDYDFWGKGVIDVGSSTGGFTEYALKAGAHHVVAIEKGTNQMKAPLRNDPRVDLHEKTDIFEIPSMVAETILVDVSFVSLKKVLAHLRKAVFNAKADYLVMLKPQFEAKPKQLENGVVKNEKMRREIIKDFEQWLKQNDFIIVKKHDNEVTGKNGNRERFYWLTMAKSNHWMYDFMGF